MQIKFKQHSWNWTTDSTAGAILHEPIYKSQIRAKKSFNKEYECAKCTEVKSTTFKDQL